MTGIIQIQVKLSRKKRLLLYVLRSAAVLADRVSKKIVERRIGAGAERN